MIYRFHIVTDQRRFCTQVHATDSFNALQRLEEEMNRHGIFSYSWDFISRRTV